MVSKSLATDSAAALDPEGAIDHGGEVGLFGRIYGTSWRFFCSLRLTIVVILGLAAGCVIGMFFDQTMTLEEHRAVWAQAAWKLWLFERLEFHDVFHSWWFGLLIILLALNLTACSIERLPKIWIDIQNPIRKLTDLQMRGIRHTFRKRLDERDFDKAREVVEAVLSTKGSHKFYETEDGSFYGFNERHRYARTGVYLVHIALLIIMFSSVATTYKGIDGMLMITEGSTGRYVRVKGPGGLTYNHDLGFYLKCDDFRLKTFIDGAPMEFESDLQVLDRNAPTNPLTGKADVISKTIQVNHPLEYKGYTFYQASYNPIPGDQLVQLDICKRPNPAVPAEMAAYEQCKNDARNIHKVAIGDRVQMPDGSAFVPIEIIPEYGGLGGAVKVQKLMPDNKTTSFVVFRNYPNWDKNVRRGEYIVGFRGFDQQYATGIQVGRTPFINLVFIGFVLMFTGMYMAFFMSQRRYWARIRRRGDGQLELVFAGAARRHQYAFEEEFNKVKESLTEIFGKEESVADRARALREQRKKAREAAKADQGAEDEGDKNATSGDGDGR